MEERSTQAPFDVSAGLSDGHGDPSVGHSEMGGGHADELIQHPPFTIKIIHMLPEEDVGILARQYLTLYPRS